MLTSGFLKAESCSAPGYQHTQVTITPERERGRTLVSYNFLLLIFLIVIHWVFPGLGRSASILENTGNQTLLTVPQPTPTPCQGYSSLALEPQVWNTGKQIRNQGTAETMRQPNSICTFSIQSLYAHADSNCPAPSSVERGSQGPCTCCCCTKCQDCRQYTSHLG